MSIVVDSSAALVAALKTAQSGDVILLKAGSYSAITVPQRDYEGVTIQSQDLHDPAVISSLKVYNTGGLEFKNIDFALSERIEVNNSHDIVFDASEFHGRPDMNLTDEPPGFSIRASSGITIQNSEFHHLASGVGHLNSEHLLIKDNVFRDIRMDGVRGGGSSWVTIDGNYFTDWRRFGGEHADLVQFWTSNTTTSAHDIVITDNVFFRGDGSRSQGIFLGNENGIAYKDVTITGNFIAGTSYHGISVFKAEGVTVADNYVSGFSDMESWITLSGVTGATLQGNDTNVYKLSSNAELQNLDNATVGRILDGGVAAYLRFTTATIVGSANEAGTGDDMIVGSSREDYLRGGEGSDQMIGGASFDDLNGNQGADTISGGFGDDWVVGGRDGDVLYGDGGQDLVYGNLGDDTCFGGGGADTVRGGQGNDVVQGGAGNDFVAGDLGLDTLTGGAGADVFYSFGSGGADVITDFDRAEGDVIQLEAGSSWSAAQRGADVVVSIGGGAELLLNNVSLASLTNGWIIA